VLASLAVGFVGCSKDGANVAEPQELSIDSGIPSPEDGMPGSMKQGATSPPAKKGGN
jgi:hypothetical protein